MSQAALQAEWEKLTPGQKRALDALCSIGKPVPVSARTDVNAKTISAPSAKFLVRAGLARVTKGGSRPWYMPSMHGTNVWLSCEPPYTEEELAS